MEKNGDKNVEYVTAFQNVVHEFLVEIADFPKVDEQFLVILHLLIRIGQVSLN